MSHWLTVEDMLLWCREIDNADTRAVLTRLGEAVELAVAQHLNRPVLASQEALDAIDPPPAHAIVADSVIKQAALLMVSHLNDHREATTEVNLEEMPYGYVFLLNDYRIRSNP